MPPWDPESVRALLREHAVSIALGTLAGLCALMSIAHPVPPLAELVEVTGVIERADIYRNCRGRVFCEHALLVTLEGRPGRLRMEPPMQALQIPRTKVRTYVERAPRIPATDGDAVRAWGLWVNDKPVRTVDEAIAEDGFVAQRVLPILTVLFLAMALARVITRWEPSESL